MSNASGTLPLYCPGGQGNPAGSASDVPIWILNRGAKSMESGIPAQLLASSLVIHNGLRSQDSDESRDGATKVDGPTRNGM